MATEFAWVIEMGRSPVSAPEYWAGNRWSTDHADAIRFARKEDAERTAKGFDDDPAPEADYRFCEHGWG